MGVTRKGLQVAQQETPDKGQGILAALSIFSLSSPDGEEGSLLQAFQKVHCHDGSAEQVIHGSVSSMGHQVVYGVVVICQVEPFLVAASFDF